MQLIVWCCLFVGIFTVASSIQQQSPGGGSGNIVTPKLVIPGEWKVNKDDTLLFLHLGIPSDLSQERVKIMTSGESIMVIVTDQPEVKPETNAVKKYRLILDALKQQAGYDEKQLKKHLEEWYETEEDDEVRVLVKSALDSLQAVRDAKVHEQGPPPTLRIPLGMLAKQVSRSNASSVPSEAVQSHSKAGGLSTAFLAGTAPHNEMAKSTMQHPVSHAVLNIDHHLHNHLRIIKESFSVDVPFPVSAGQVFVLQTPDKDLMVTMPLKRSSLEAQGISTGGKPFIPCPVYTLRGELIGGPNEAPDLYSAMPSLSRQYFVDPDALRPLES